MRVLAVNLANEDAQLSGCNVVSKFLWSTKKVNAYVWQKNLYPAWNPTSYHNVNNDYHRDTVIYAILLHTYNNKCRSALFYRGILHGTVSISALVTSGKHNNITTFIIKFGMSE